MHAELVGSIAESGGSGIWSVTKINLSMMVPYVLSQSPILKIVVPVFTEPEMLLEVVDPAVTVTEDVATGYSPW